MDALIVKILATALTLSQVVTRPDAVKTEFDPVRDRAEMVSLLRSGCAHMRKTFEIEDIPLDELIATAMSDPQALAGEVKTFRGIDFGALQKLYTRYCGQQPQADPEEDLNEVAGYLNKTLADLPDHRKLKGMTLPGTTTVLDYKGDRYTEVFEPGQRRLPVPLGSIPKLVQQAFIAAEDKRFAEHRGVDERAIVRAFVGTLAGRRQGGSTITQQLVKNLLVGDDVTYERKIREMVIASRVERALSKDEILELYLNSIYLGRGAWGIELAARNWFGKPASELSLAEGAQLAALAKGPGYYAPDRYPERARERLAYVLSRMQEDGYITAAQQSEALQHPPVPITLTAQRNDAGYYAIDQLVREAKAAAGIERLTAAAYTVRSTIHPELQRRTEAALQEGLAIYEERSGRAKFQGPEANLADAIRQIETGKQGGQGVPAWRQALEEARLPLYDVHWTPAIVIEKRDSRERGLTVRVGLKDGRTMLLSAAAGAARRLQLHDVIYVRVLESKGKSGPIAALRVRPEVQGAAVVLENRTGKVLAMAGGFSYPLSQFNRSSQAYRQPGSALKPLTYLAALASGLQPNTLVWDEPVSLPPVGSGFSARERDYWTPKNYDSSSSGPITLRAALEYSKNLVTARLLSAITPDPEESLKRVCMLTLEAQLYKECINYYPFVLGAQPVRLIDLAAFYAAVANEGALPRPYLIESIERGGERIYEHPSDTLAFIGSADRPAFYQLKTILQGVLERGTARSLRQLAPYVGGKTGTSDNENDAWFVGFSNEVTVAVWVGYDNPGDKRQTLGRGETGATVAIPIFEPIMNAVWTEFAPRTAMKPASPEAQRQLAAVPIDLRTGSRIRVSGGQTILEHLRKDRWGQVADTQYRIVPEEEAALYRDYDSWWGDGDARRGDSYSAWGYGQSPWWRPQPYEPQPYWRRPSSPWDYESRRERRIDPDYFWGNRRLY